MHPVDERERAGRRHTRQLLTKCANVVLPDQVIISKLQGLSQMFRTLAPVRATMI
jgi:hypothetical protein